MRIISYKNSQYAGMRNQNISFAPGMNVILGNNETGKSTMLTGIYDTLMIHSNLNLKQDTEFINQRFPTGGGNCIDGTVSLEAAGQKITIQKKWDKNKKDSYTTLDSVNQYSGEAAEEQIKKLLTFGEAIYNNIVFGRQNNENAILDWFYSFLSASSNIKIDDASIIDARAKIAEVLSASGGVSEDLYLSKVEEKLQNLSSHWNFSKDCPEKERGIENPWEREVGEILQSYYQLKRQEQDFENHRTLINSIENSEKTLKKVLEEKKSLEKQLEELQQLSPDVNKKDSLLTLQKEFQKNIDSFQDAVNKWEGKTKKKENLNALLIQAVEKKNREQFKQLSDKLKNLDISFQKLKDYNDAIKGFESIDNDVSNYNSLQCEIQQKEGMLGSAKLHAKITMLADYNAQMSTADDFIPEIKGQYDSNINGFAKIVLPGIAEILITPQQLNVPILQYEISNKKSIAENILKQYGVKSLEELDQKQQTVDSINKNIHVLEENIKSILNNSTVEQLREEKQKIQIDENINISEDFNILIESELEDNVDSNNLDICIPIIQTKNESIRAEIKEYIQKYGSMDKLHEKINIEREKLTKSQEEFTNCKYESIMEKKDFDEEINRIKELLGINKDNSGLTQKIGDWNQKIGEQKGKAEDIDLDAEEKDIQNSQNLLKQKKELYQFYYKIKEDFITLKSQQVNKFDAFYNLFNTYLSAITEEQVQAGSERLKTHSGELFYQNFRKTKGTKNTDDLKALLSQGTKQSILLAFRLALLKYYYPEESGVIILDDVLLDMDPKRRERSAKLLQEFSKNNQVIFTTCDPGIADILGGNQISL